MALRRIFVAALLSVATFAGTPSHAQDKPQDQQRKLSNEERKEYFALNELVDAISSGKQPAPADLALTFHHHYLRSNKNVYIPYVVEINGGKFSSFPVAMYVRAVSKSAPAPPQPDAKAAEKPGDNAPVSWPFADVYFLTEKNVTMVGDTAQVARAVELPPGDYTLYVSFRERQPKDRKVQPKTAVIVHQLTVPDLETGLTTSSVMLAKSLDPAPEKLTAQQQLEQPFTISGYRIAPLFNTAIPQANELLFVFFIYNEGVAASGKPDLDVDYHFFRASEDKPFTRLATQSFNATTLPGQFDLKLGHQVFVGQGIPLNNPAMPFAPGEYRMEIKITDKTNGQSITRNVPFKVS